MKELEKALKNKKKQEGDRLVICLDLAKAENPLFEDIEQILLGYPGDVPLEFELERRGDFQASLRAQKPTGIRPDPELLGRLKKLCGATSIRLEKFVK